MVAVSVLALLLMAAVPVQEAHAQGAYSERYNVYVAGSDALWYFTFGGINGSSHLSALESTPGLSWYNVTAIDTSGWQSDFQVFGARGYNLLPVPYLTPSGLFLTMGSDSYADASAAAAALDSYLLTDFVSMSNGTGTYGFYSPVSFSSLIPVTLLKFLPTSEHGFAGALTPSSFASTPSPFVVLEGTKSSSGFDHSLVVGSIAYSALSSSGVPSVLSYFGATAPSLVASNKSSSSVVHISALDGVITSTDVATVTSSSATFTGSYTLSISPGKHISGVNATVVEQSAPLLATRAVDTGVLKNGDDMAVTLTFTNLSPADTISNITYADNWWNSTGDFKFLGGQDNLTSQALGSTQTTTPVYRLQYTGSSTGPLTIPASVVRYQYTADGKTFKASTTLNPIRLSLGVDDAVVYATLVPDGTLNKPAGSTQKFSITLVNVGTLPASSVVVAGQSVAGLAAKSGSAPGGTATVTVSQVAASLSSVNITRSYGVSYQDPNGTALEASTNVLTDVFSHVAMVTGFPVLTVGVTTAPISSSATNLTLTFVSSNLGLNNVTSFRAVGTLPAGLGCGAASGAGIICSGGQVTISYARLNQSTTERSYMKFNVTNPGNLIFTPFSFSGVTSGENVTGRSNLAAAPLGVKLTKVFSPAQLFGGMGSNVQANAANAGPLGVYNLTLKTTADSFDSLTSNSSLSKGPIQTLTSGSNTTLSYSVSMLQTYGNLSATPVTASFYFAGTAFSQQGAKPRVEIYQPLSVSISTYPTTPEEGKNFTITINIDNPSGVTVNNVAFSLPIPSGLSLSDLQNAQVVSGLLSIQVGSLAPSSSAIATARAVASSGITVPFSGGKLTFSYSGITVSGIVPKSSGIAIAEDVTTRYLIPTAFIILVMLAVAFYIRRMASSAPASQK